MQKTTPASSDPELAPGQMFTDPQFRRLKVAVILMAVVLIVGFGVVVGRIVYLFQRPSAGVTTIAPPIERPDRALTLPAGAIVRHISIAGDRLAVHYEAPAGSGIRIIDLATGAQQQVSVSPSATP